MPDGPELLIRTDAGSLRAGPSASVTIGRATDCDLVLSDLRVSRRHLSVCYLPEEGWVVSSLSGAGGTFLGPEHVNRCAVVERLVLRLGDARLGPAVELCVDDATAGLIPPPVVVRVGRAADNDVVLPELFVSRHHAEFRRLASGEWEVLDLGGHDGTFVDGLRVSHEIAHTGQQIVVGQSTLRLTDAGPQVVECPGQPVLEARGASAILSNGQTILDDVSFSLAENTLIAIVGTTGSGKSTLLKTLTGFRPPEVGHILVNGLDLYEAFGELGRRIGYVPQDDILHPQLSTRRALEFGAELRFPVDVSREERRTRVQEVMVELGLADRANVAIDRLSGGQRKRTSVAMELLTRPNLLLLDEPTSGLDPGYEKSVMELLRRLADGGRVVVVVTHSVQSLDLCDRVMFLAPGGRTAFFGPPPEALEFFGRSQYASVFQALETSTPESWRAARSPRGAQPRPSAPSPADPLVGAPAAPVSRTVWWRQVSTLARRQLAILGTDRKNLAYLAAEVLIPAVLILALVGKQSFDPGPTTNPNAAATLLGALAVAATAVGAANAVREVVKELPLYFRERSAGLSRSAYLVSKALVLGALTALQVAVLVVIATRGAAGPTKAVLLGSPLLELTIAIALGGIAAMALGLLISCLVSSSEKAMALIPVIFLVEWLFSGMAVNLQTKPVMLTLGYLTSANWSMSMAASSADLYAVEDQALRFQPAPPANASGKPAPRDQRWRHSIGNWLVCAIALMALTAIALWAATVALARKEPFRQRKGPAVRRGPPLVSRLGRAP